MLSRSSTFSPAFSFVFFMLVCLCVKLLFSFLVVSENVFFYSFLVFFTLIQCGERHECFVTREEFLALEKKLSSATKRATCFVAILCAVIALLLVVAGVTGVYVYMVTQSRSCETSDVNRNHGDISRLPELSHFEPRSGLVAEENGHQATDETEHIRQKRSKPKKTNACKCGRELKRIRRQAKKEAKELEKSFEKHTERLESLESKLRNYSVLTPNSNGTYIGAAHYATYVDNDIISKHLGNLSDGNLTSYTLCKNVSILSGGMLCRNRTLIANGERAKLNVFREAKWMKTTAETPIFRQRKDGSFKAVRSGIYHVYAHVLFYDIHAKAALGIERKSDDVETLIFRCESNVRSDVSDVRYGVNSKLVSCSTGGSLYLKEGDLLTVRNIYADSDIDVSPDVSYFGALMFSNHPSSNTHAQ